MESTTKVVKEFQKEVEEMNEDDARLKFIEEWKKSMLEKKRSRWYPKLSRIMYGKNVIR